MHEKKDVMARGHACLDCTIQSVRDSTIVIAMRTILVSVLVSALCAAGAQTAQQPDDPARKAAAAGQRGEQDAAELNAEIGALRQAVAAAPEDVGLHMRLAAAYYRKGDLNHARQELTMLHASHPQDVRAAVMLGYTYIRLGRDAEAYDAVAGLEAGHESDLDLEYVLAYAMIRTGRADQGVPKMEKVAQATGKADAWMIAGVSRFEREQYHEARADAEEAVRINPKFPGAQTLMCKSHYVTTDYAGAAAACKEALIQNAQDFDANLFLGVLYMKAGDYAGAKPLMEMALTLRPGYPLARLELARIDRSTGNYTEAAAILESLVKNDPEWLEPHILLSSVYYILNRPEDGKRERAIVQRLEDQVNAAEAPKQ
jgi:tetratricopeptide (TPR) repeat protein